MAANLHKSCALGREGIVETLKASGVGTWDWDVSGDRVMVCPVTAGLYGLGNERIAQGLRLADFLESIHPEDRMPFSKTVKEVTRRGGLFVAEYRTRPIPGEYRWVLARGHFEPDPDGVVRRGRGIVIDLTASKEDGFGEGRALFAATADGRADVERFAGSALELWQSLQWLESRDRAYFMPALRALLMMIGRRLGSVPPSQAVSRLSDHRGRRAGLRPLDS